MKSKKIYEAFKPKADLLLLFQMCRAYYGDNLSLMGVVEKILKAQLNVSEESKLIHRAVSRAQGKSNPTISIPQLGYEKKVYDILDGFVQSHFDKMIAETLKGTPNYPLKFRDIIERNSD
jgi:hypothetical protein